MNDSLKEISKHKDGKIIIDIEKNYKNKNFILIDLNSSKLQSPIILIDPTFKERNALAALSKESFDKFKNHCKEFLKSPSLEKFEIKKVNIEEIKKNAEKNKNDFLILELKTERQEGDIAGSKLLKFYRHLNKEIEKFFIVKKHGFDYSEKKTAMCYFVGEKKKEVIKIGPGINDFKNVQEFRKKHKDTFEKNEKIFAREKINFSLKEFIEKWILKNKKKVNDMNIRSIKFLN